MQVNNTDAKVAMTEDESGFDIRMIWAIFMEYKYWFLASVIVCVTSAMIYLRYTTPIYSISTKILIKDKQQGGYASSINNTFSELGFTNSSNGFDNEIEIIGTKSLNKRVVRALKLYTTYVMEGKLKDHEIYGKYSPYTIDLSTDEEVDSLKSGISAEIVDAGAGIKVTLKAEGEEFVRDIKLFPTTIKTPCGNVVIDKNSRMVGARLNGQILHASISPIDAVSGGYAGSISATPTSKTTTVALITRSDNIPERSVDYLNELVKAYNMDADEDNRYEAEKTSEFINQRLAAIGKDLNESEGELERYKAERRIVNYGQDASMDATQNMQYSNKLADLETQIHLLDALIEWVNNMKGYDVVPDNMLSNSNPSLNTMITEYNKLVLDRKRLLRSANETSPTVALKTEQAQSYLASIKTALGSTKQGLNIQRKELVKQQSKYENLVSAAPAKERQLGSMGRLQTVKSDLYVMLLQKNEETQITLKSMAYKAKQIEEPMVSGPVSPKRQMILLVALALGIGLPYAIYFIRNMFRYRVEGKEDIAKYTTVPLFGSIPYVKALAKGNRTIVLQENHNSVMMECYRSLRSNLPFVISKEQKVLLFTSCTSGEGKTVIAANFGTCVAFAGKKVLLIGLDIRKPRLATLFNLAETEIGISNYFARDPRDFDYLDKLIQNSGISDNLDIL